MQQLATDSTGTSIDFLPLKGIDHIEFYVANAKQSAYFYRYAFGMALTAYRGPETGTRDRASYVVEQNQIRFVLTTPLDPESVIAGHILKHGDGVKNIALTVDDAATAYRETTRRGGRGVAPPAITQDDQGEVLELARERNSRPTHLLEKDVWVVWTLGTLFDSPVGANLTFKGGTSL